MKSCLNRRPLGPLICWCSWVVWLLSPERSMGAGVVEMLKLMYEWRTAEA